MDKSGYMNNLDQVKVNFILVKLITYIETPSSAESNFFFLNNMPMEFFSYIEACAYS